MKRSLILLVLVIPYWLWVGRQPGHPHLPFASLHPLLYAGLSLLFYLPLAWWIFRLDRDDVAASLSRIMWGSLGGIAVLHMLAQTMGYPQFAKLFLGGPAGFAFGGVGLANSIKDVESFPLWVSIFGYTLGVGLTEEISKAVMARPDIINGLRTRAAFGFVAGIGFGVAEAIIYSYRHYAGHADWTTYLIRYFFVVGLHGCMSAIAVLSLPHDWWDWDRWLITAIRLLPIAFLHGAYDALLMRSHPIWAGVVATGTILMLPILLWTEESLAGEV